MGLPPWRAGKPHFNCSKLAQIWALHRRSWARNKQKRPLQSNCTVKLPISRWSLVSIDLRHCMFAHYFMFKSSYIQRYFGEKWIKVVQHEKNTVQLQNTTQFVDWFRLPNKTIHVLRVELQTPRCQFSMGSSLIPRSRMGCTWRGLSSRWAYNYGKPSFKTNPGGKVWTSLNLHLAYHSLSKLLNSSKS